MVAYLSKKGNHQGICLVMKTFKLKLNIKLFGQNPRSFLVKLPIWMHFEISNRDFEPLVDLWPRTVKQNHKSLVVSFLHSCKVYKVDTTSAIQSVF